MPGMKATMDEYASGVLHSGSENGPVVKNRKQAIAIGLSEERKADGKPKRKSKSKKRGDGLKRYAKGLHKRMR